MQTKKLSQSILKRRLVQCQKWVNNNIKERDILSLANEYWQQSMVLYTGAGVSICPPIKGKGIQYGILGWINLL